MSDVSLDSFALRSPASATAAPSTAHHSPSTDKIAKTAEDFEAVFIAQMLEHMFPEEIDPVFGDPETNDIYRSWQIDEYAKIIARSGGIGIASHVSEELLKLQDITSGAGRNKVTEALSAKESKFYGLNR